MTHVLVVGSKGNMGSRYATILNHLGVSNDGIDIGVMPALTKKITHVIIATPTFLHIEHILHYLNLGVPILCEKPFAKEPHSLEKLISSTINDSHLISMVNNYYWLSDSQSVGETSYNYFKSGGDGLAFDCINIIGLAKGEVILKNDSPIWQTKINGHALQLMQIDYSYIEMIRRWLKSPESNFSYALLAHEKVWAYKQNHPEIT